MKYGLKQTIVVIASAFIGMSAFAKEVELPKINEKRIVNDFIELVKIRSQSKNERQIADVLKGRLLALGGQVYEDDSYKAFGGNAGNVFAYFKGSVSNAPVMMINAHMDTVDPSQNIMPRVIDGVIRTSGNSILGADDKAGVVTILEALATVKESKIPHADILVVFTVAEEIGMVGISHINKEMLSKADFGIAIDGSSGPGDTVYSGIGANKLKIVIEGKSAHAGNVPENGVNAIALAANAIASLKQGRIDHETTSNVGIAKCGVAINIVAERCELEAEVRSIDKSKLDYQTQLMADTFTRAATEGKGKANIEISPIVSAFSVPLDSMPIIAMTNAMKALGLTPKIGKATGGGSDANVFNQYGIPTVKVAAAGGLGHTRDEYLNITDLIKSGNIVVSLIREAAKLQKK